MTSIQCPDCQRQLVDGECRSCGFKDAAAQSVAEHLAELRAALKRARKDDP